MIYLHCIPALSWLFPAYVLRLCRLFKEPLHSRYIGGTKAAQRRCIHSFAQPMCSSKIGCHFDLIPEKVVTLAGKPCLGFCIKRFMIMKNILLPALLLSCLFSLSILK
jgi:hypothetical protein